MTISFGQFALDTDREKLFLNGHEIELSPRLFQVLRFLAESAGRAVSNHELNDRVWRGTATDNTIRVTMTALRKKLGPSNYHLIETVPSLGYRLVLQDAPASRAASRWPAAIFGCAVIVLLSAVVFQPLNEPRVRSYRQLTDDGLLKHGPIMVSAGSLYFSELTPEGHRTVRVPVTGGQPQLVPNLADVRVTDISKSGAVLGFVNGQADTQELWLWPAIGSAPKRISTRFLTAAWSADAQTIVAGGYYRLAVLHADGPDPLMVRDLPGFLYSLNSSPNGDTIRVATKDQTREVHRIWELPAVGGPPHPITGELEGSNGMTWTADGRYFLYDRSDGPRSDLWYVHEGQSWIPGRPRSGRLTSGPDRWTFPAAGSSANQVFAIGEKVRPQLVAYHAHNRTWEPYLDGMPADDLDFTRDGQWVAYSRIPERTIWISRSDGTGARRLTDTSLEARQPHYSPDGREIAFMGKRGRQPWRVYAVPANGGPVRELTHGIDNQGVPTWSADGAYIAYGEYPTAKPDIDMRIHLVETATGTDTTLPGSEGLWTARWSPDGRDLLALTRDSRTARLFDIATSRWHDLAHVQFMENPSWSRTGDYIYANGTDADGLGKVFRIRRRDGNVEAIIDTRGFSGAGEPWFGRGPDGSVLATRGLVLSDIYSLDCVLP